MSEENVEIVRAHVEAWRAEDASARSFVPRSPRRRGLYPAADEIDRRVYGHERLTEFFRRYAGMFEDYKWEIERLTDLGSGAALAVFEGRPGAAKGSGVHRRLPP